MTKLTDEVWKEFTYTVRELASDSPITVSELARRFHVSLNTITRWIDENNLNEYIRDGRLGVHATNKKDRNVKIYEEYWKKGTSLAKIGRKYNISRQRVHVIIKTVEQHRLNGQL